VSREALGGTGTPETGAVIPASEGRVGARQV